MHYSNFYVFSSFGSKKINIRYGISRLYYFVTAPISITCPRFPNLILVLCARAYSLNDPAYQNNKNSNHFNFFLIDFKSLTKADFSSFFFITNLFICGEYNDRLQFNLWRIKEVGLVKRYRGPFGLFGSFKATAKIMKN